LFEKILVAVDGSEHSTRALETAIPIAKKFKGKLTLISVYSVSVRPIVMPEPTTLTPPGVPVVTPEEVTKATEASQEVAKKILKEAADKAEAEQVHVETMLAEGYAPQEIIKAAKAGNFNLIVLGARGTSRLREILVGSVCDTVMREATIPVLLVK
jgi:nucleotide-binding universal stress UspA family protein